MFTLSNFTNLSMKSFPTITYLALFQSVFSTSNVHTASNTNTTIGGGLMNPLTSAMSFLLILDNASSASFNAGNALFNSL